MKTKLIMLALLLLSNYGYTQINVGSTIQQTATINTDLQATSAIYADVFININVTQDVYIKSSVGLIELSKQLDGQMIRNYTDTWYKFGIGGDMKKWSFVTKVGYLNRTNSVTLGTEIGHKLSKKFTVVFEYNTVLDGLIRTDMGYGIIGIGGKIIL